MKLSVIGLGKLGSPLMAVFASKGYEVIGVDINSDFVEKVNSGIAPVDEPFLQELITNNRDRISATTDFGEAALNSDVTFLIVPTPSQKDGLFSNSYLLKAVEQLGFSLKNKNTYHLVVITSTVIPGSCDGEIKSVLEKSSGKIVGKDLGLCYNPEFIALGSVVKNMLYPDMILVGESDSKAGDILEKIYTTTCEKKPPVMRMNLVNAEMCKISVNTFVTTKISYANMLSDICDRLPGADVNVVTKAVGLDSRIGGKYLQSAVAFGGPCFPRDNIAMSALARKVGARADIAQSTQAINEYQYERLIAAVTSHAKGGKVGILGLAYKSGTYVVEESQGIKISNLLLENGYQVSVYDPMALSEAKKVLDKKVHVTCSIEECIQNAGIILIMTAWPEFEQNISAEMCAGKVVIDPWRVLSNSSLEKVCDLVYLGCGNVPSFDDCVLAN